MKTGNCDPIICNRTNSNAIVVKHSTASRLVASNGHLAVHPPPLPDDDADDVENIVEDVTDEDCVDDDDVVAVTPLDDEENPLPPILLLPNIERVKCCKSLKRTY